MPGEHPAVLLHLGPHEVAGLLGSGARLAQRHQEVAEGPAGLVAELVLAAPAGPAPLPAKFLAPRDTVVVDTSLGTFSIRLFPKKALASAANFLRYVEDRFYDGTTIHRVVPDFVVQGGGLDDGLQEKKGRGPIKNEAGNGLSNKRSTVACARAVGPDSATSQFYVNLKDNPNLDAGPARVGYCIFGEVVKGMDVVDRIARARTESRGGHHNVPTPAIVIRSIRRER